MTYHRHFTAKKHRPQADFVLNVAVRNVYGKFYSMSYLFLSTSCIPVNFYIGCIGCNVNYYFSNLRSNFRCINVHTCLHVNSSFLWHKILVLIFNMLIHAKVGHSKSVEMHEDASDIYRSTSNSDWYFIVFFCGEMAVIWHKIS
jgi:hypothetical protein